MKPVFDFLGGRKAALVLLAGLVIALSRFLGLTAEEIERIFWLGLGGSGAIAFEDAAKHLRGKRS